MVIYQHAQRFLQQSVMLLLLLPLLLVTGAAQATLTASVDRTTIAKNDIIQLTIRSDQGPIEHTDFSALEQHFSIINRQRSNQIAIVNGKKTASYDLQLTLFPIDAGRFTIPAFSSHGENSQPIKITVTDSPAASSQQHEEVFLKTTISKPQVYVQEPLLLTVQLYHSVGLREAQLSSLEVHNAAIDEVGDQSKQEKILNGVRYSVIEKHYSITPEQSGSLQIPQLTFTGRTSYRGVYSTPGRYVRTRSLAHQVEVLPKPASYPTDAPWLPTSALSITDSWDSNPPTLTVGESVTRTLTLSALNLNAAQLPDLTLPDVPSLKLYPDQSRNENTATKSGMLGQRIFSTAIVATQPGQVEFPELKLYWWNTDSKQLEQAIVPAVTVTVKAAINSAVQATPKSSPVEQPVLQNNQLISGRAASHPVAAGSGFWPYLSALFALLWMATLLLWWQTIKRSKAKAANFVNEALEPQHLSARTAFKDVKKACRNNNPASARQAIIHWFRSAHPDQPVKGLYDICSYYQNPGLNELIQEMEQCLYAANSSEWEGEKLFDCLYQLHKKQALEPKSSDQNDLKPLYPF